MKILIVGGAGYIGSHMNLILRESGHNVIVLDNLVSGHADAVIHSPLIIGDISDARCLDSVFSENKFDAVLCFASHIKVGESISNPAKYYQNNVAGTLTLLNAMLNHNVGNFIFSSTAAIFGEPSHVPIDERHQKMPVNPYGRSKLMVEDILLDYNRAYSLNYIALRYFNAAGADPKGMVGERHDPETHLIPLAIRAAIFAENALTIYGKDYPTPDGTCIRDYIHVLDLCAAHMLALEYLLQGGLSGSYNLGNGQGFSVLEVVNAVEEIVGRRPMISFSGRRQGDPARLVADSSEIRKNLGWEPIYSDLKQIVRHAYAWEKIKIARSL